MCVYIYTSGEMCEMWMYGSLQFCWLSRRYSTSCERCMFFNVTRLSALICLLLLLLYQNCLYTYSHGYKLYIFYNYLKQDTLL